MATIKSYTDISQSKKLAEILPIESADMYYSHEFVNSAGDYYKLNIALEGYLDDNKFEQWPVEECTKVDDIYRD